jgi:protein-L-isoaspartate(D-aspartate) O-methyltransferase
MTTEPLTRGQADQRLHMVNGQLRTSGVSDSTVLAAFLEVPRERFVARDLARLAYLDQDQPAAGVTGRRLLAPRTLALLLQAAAIAPGERVLDVGGGSGYGAALLAHIGANVVALESNVAATREALAGVSGIEIVEGDLAAGAPGKAPFDAILIHGGFEEIPEALLAQLAKGGRLVGIDAREGSMRGVILDKAAAGYSERSLFDAKADVLDTFRRTPCFAF